MFKHHEWRRWVALPAAGAVAMAVLLPCMALMRDTTAHDWYAATKITVTETMLAVGFADESVTEYRTPDGDSFRVTRAGLAVYGEPIRARERILSTAVENAFLGVGAGAACGMFFIVLLGGANAWQRTRTGWPTGTARRSPPEYPEAWSEPGCTEYPPQRDGGGTRSGVLVVSPTQSGDPVEVYGPVEFRGPLPVGPLARGGAFQDTKADGRLTHADVPAPEKAPALPAAAAPDASAKADTNGAESPTRKSRTQARKEPTATSNGDAVRESENAAKAKPGKGGGGIWF